jgi:hypothetical protein
MQVTTVVCSPCPRLELNPQERFLPSCSDLESSQSCHKEGHISTRFQIMGVSWDDDDAVLKGFAKKEGGFVVQTRWKSRPIQDVDLGIRTHG